MIRITSVVLALLMAAKNTMEVEDPNFQGPTPKPHQLTETTASASQNFTKIHPKLLE